MAKSKAHSTLLAILALAISFPVWADITGNVVGVADGDTITVLDAVKVQHKIRLTGIDAPEKKQPFGNRSKQSLGFPSTARARRNHRCGRA